MTMTTGLSQRGNTQFGFRKARRRSTLTLILLSNLSLLALACSPTAAGEPSAELAALSSDVAEISLSRFDAGFREITLIARDGSKSHPTKDSLIEAIASGGFTLKVQSPEVHGSDVSWKVHISGMPQSPDSGMLEFVLYSAKDHNEVVSRCQVQVKVAPALLGAAGDDADVSIKASFKSLAKGTGQAFVIIKNKSTEAIAVEKIDFLVSDSVKATLDSRFVPGSKVGAKSVSVVPITVEAQSRPVTGDSLLIAQVTLGRGSGGDAQSAIVETELSVPVEVAGVSEVLKVLDIPTLLLIPGALILATLSLLYVAVVKPATEPKLLEWKSAGFWVVAITISIVCYLVLAFARNRFTELPDFLVAYSTSDVAILWLSCIAIAGFAFILWIAWKWYWRRKRVPALGDKPLELLKKLRSRRFPFYLRQFKYPSTNDAIFRTDFEPIDGKNWYVPKINAATEDASLSQALSRANDQPTGLAALIKLLERRTFPLIGKRLVQTHWPVGSLRGPELLKDGDLGAASSGSAISPLEIKYQPPGASKAATTQPPKEV